MSKAAPIPATIPELGRRIIMSIRLAQERMGACDWTAVSWAKEYDAKLVTVQRMLRSLEASGFVFRLTPHGSRNPLRKVDEDRVAAAMTSVVTHSSPRRNLVPLTDESVTSERPLTTVVVDARAQVSQSVQASSLPASTTVQEFFGVPCDLFRQAAEAVSFLQRRRPDLGKNRSLGRNTNALMWAAEGRGAAPRWYTAVALMRLSPPPKDPHPAFFATIDDIVKGRTLAPEGIQPDGVILNAFKVLVSEHDHALLERCIAAHGGDLHSAALQGPERLRSWLAMNRPREEPNAAREAFIAARLKESEALFGDIDDEPADESEPIRRTTADACSARR